MADADEAGVGLMAGDGPVDGCAAGVALQPARRTASEMAGMRTRGGRRTYAAYVGPVDSGRAVRPAQQVGDLRRQRHRVEWLPQHAGDGKGSQAIDIGFPDTGGEEDDGDGIRP